MAWQIPLSTSVSGFAATLSETDSLFVSEGVTLASTGSYTATFYGSGQQILVYGTIAGAGGIYGGTTENAQIVVGDTGRIVSFNGKSISLNGTGSEIRNAGTIQTWKADSEAILFTGNGNGSTAEIDNSGDILGTARAIVASGMGLVHLTNSGLISAHDFAYSDLGASKDTILNTGTIKGMVSLGGGDDFLDSRGGLVKWVEGGTGNDRLFVGEGNSYLNGDAGNDTLMGGAGADVLTGAADIDTASYASAAAGVTASLANAAQNTGDAKGDIYNAIERLIGSKFADTLVGNAEANQLTGGAGADTLTGGAGADRFVFATKPGGTSSADRVTDFQTDLDEVRLDDASFAGLALGNLGGGAFWASNAGTAHDGTDRVIYEKDTGWVRFDADGNGAGAAVAFAKLAAGLNLGADDFFVY